MLTLPLSLSTQIATLRREGNALLRAARAMPADSHARLHDTMRAYEMHAEADGLEWRQGGDRVTAAACDEQAERWRRVRQAQMEVRV